jgi:hypothetical protein
MKAKPFVLFALLGACGSVAQQPPADQVQAAAQPQKPKTQLEQFQAKTGSVLIKGYTQIGGLSGKFGTSINVIAMEFTDAASGAKDYIARVDKNSTKLGDFEAIYRTKGDLSIDRFSSASGTMVAIQSGAFGAVGGFFDSKELPKIKALLEKAQTTLQAVK